WGTEIDINAVDDEYFESPVGNKVYAWLQINASKFGFCQPYTQRELRSGKGFNEEKWHWSYKKLSDPILQEFIKIYSNQMIGDFKGYKEVRRIDLLSEYILSINTCN
ncbi:MAG: D-alanyl-D-alanine carboxypeptidase family protein, partial [Saprospiraceae bacterium]